MMHANQKQVLHRRAGFTLVEMLVVITIILILATLVVAFVPTVQEKERTAHAAGQVQGWLGVAKQWALRDQVPRGIRLVVPNPQNPLVTTLQYIEKPDDFTGGLLSVPNPNPSSSLATASGAPNQLPPDFYGGFGPTNPAQWAVQPGDYLEISGSSTLFVIQQVLPNPNNPLTSNMLALAGQPVVPIQPTADYRIVRQPRRRTGEPDLVLPDKVAIDLNTNGAYPWYQNPLPPPNLLISGYNPGTAVIDILFSPFGDVIGAGTGDDKIQLWVRDTSADPTGNQTFNGEQVLITIYIRTGMIAANRIDPTLDPNALPPFSRYLQPYSFTQNGGPSGL